ncbi:Thioredoxin [Candidatus Ornithobacterium hominis]|uniref:thioredoxin family protein n=1 Tax=Candidatus Ornithobacterium hominis TaxID=2497989 RepID=UPI0024BCF775|nr:thioredoxin domain-containing protein [Candidatus Ornithobacterium hominis]CAI9429147.1 Thioredoxin [Candidatus Ornithobacterium hominis]
MFFSKKKKIKPLEISSLNFNQEIFESEEPILLNFYADWCQPCQVMKSLISRLTKERGDSRGKICKVNLDANPQIASMFGVRSVPNLLFIHKKKVHLRQTGLLPYGELSDIWNQFLKDLDDEIIV